MTLLKKPTEPELNALARFAETQDGILIFDWLQRNANAYMEASLNPDSDARTRQAQGSWTAITSFINTARLAARPESK